jgi:hypothetical protein
MLSAEEWLIIEIELSDADYLALSRAAEHFM